MFWCLAHAALSSLLKHALLISTFFGTIDNGFRFAYCITIYNKSPTEMSCNYRILLLSSSLCLEPSEMPSPGRQLSSSCLWNSICYTQSGSSIERVVAQIWTLIWYLT